MQLVHDQSHATRKRMCRLTGDTRVYQSLQSNDVKTNNVYFSHSEYNFRPIPKSQSRIMFKSNVMLVILPPISSSQPSTARVK